MTPKASLRRCGDNNQKCHGNKAAQSDWLNSSDYDRQTAAAVPDTKTSLQLCCWRIDKLNKHGPLMQHCFIHGPYAAGEGVVRTRDRPPGTDFSFSPSGYSVFLFFGV